jgi:hypothetical protein
MRRMNRVRASYKRVEMWTWATEQAPKGSTYAATVRRVIDNIMLSRIARLSRPTRSRIAGTLAARLPG